MCFIVSTNFMWSGKDTGGGKHCCFSSLWVRSYKCLLGFGSESNNPIKHNLRLILVVVMVLFGGNLGEINGGLWLSFSRRML